MSPEEIQKLISEASAQQLCMKVIWEAVMEGTAHCGWTDRAREGLVEQVQSSVSWALEMKGIK